jgi:glycosyltransferase involved in cell wall biosynthesis
MTKAAFVVQRYGPEIIGGAESLCRVIAETLVQTLGWEVTVYTTQAREYVSWKNVLPEGKETINQVSVKRFPVRFPRSLFLFAIVNHKLTPLILKLSRKQGWQKRIGYWLERLWLILQGPYCPKLVASLQKDAKDYEKVFFFTYLYYPTIVGAKKLRGSRFSLIPTAHDEIPFYFQHTEELLTHCSKILVNIAPEQALIERSMGRAIPGLRIAGIGIDVPEEGAAQPFQVQGRYVLYLGRICKAKGVQLLFDAFSSYLQRNPESDLMLILAGSKDAEFEIPASDRIRFLGFLPEDRKFSLIHQALCVVNPSQYESLSLIAIEAMLCLKPLILNQHSEVLAHYCAVTETSLPFQSVEGLAECLENVAARDWKSDENRQLLIETREWARKHYSWPVVLRAYQESPDLISQ